MCVCVCLCVCVHVCVCVRVRACIYVFHISKVIHYIVVLVTHSLVCLQYIIPDHPRSDLEPDGNHDAN